MLEVAELQSSYGRILALKGVSLRVETGEITALVGGNGAGKTTLLRCLSGVQPVGAGRIRFHGEDITAWSPHRRVAAGIAQSPEGRQVFGPLSVEDNLRLGASAAAGRTPRPGWSGSSPCSRSCATSGRCRRRGCRAGSSRCWQSAAR
jgi:branched-chain amino acid transport system ATP-binding protein